jgi:hypothetical protein
MTPPLPTTPRHLIDSGQDHDGKWWSQVTDTRTGWARKSWPFSTQRAALADAEQLVTHREHGSQPQAAL